MKIFLNIKIDKLQANSNLKDKFINQQKEMIKKLPQMK